MTNDETRTESPLPSPARLGIREVLTDALRWWEVRRLIYNGALIAVALLRFADLSRHVGVQPLFNPRTLVWLFVCAVLANICYCAAYVAEVVLQFSDYREIWRRKRWMLLIVGCAFGGVLTWFTVPGLLGWLHPLLLWPGP